MTRRGGNEGSIHQQSCDGHWMGAEMLGADPIDSVTLQRVSGDDTAHHVPNLYGVTRLTDVPQLMNRSRVPPQVKSSAN